MSNVIEFLERMGQDADLRHADDKALNTALHSADVTGAVAFAIRSKDAASLETAIGAQSNTFCGLYPVEGDQKVA